MSVIMTGRKHTKETIERMQKVQKGKIISEEQREKIRRKLTRKRINVVKSCKMCGNDFTITVVENTKRHIRDFCSRKCVSKWANKIKSENR